MYNVLLMYHLRTHCSFTLVMWEEDPDNKDLFASSCDAMRPLIEIGYATLHMAYAMPHWSSSRAKHTVLCCSSLLRMLEVHLDE